MLLDDKEGEVVVDAVGRRQDSIAENTYIFIIWFLPPKTFFQTLEINHVFRKNRFNLTVCLTSSATVM